MSGNPDLYVSNINPATSVNDWNWFSRTTPSGAFGAVTALGSELFELSPVNPEYLGTALDIFELELIRLCLQELHTVSTYSAKVLIIVLHSMWSVYESPCLS